MKVFTKPMLIAALAGAFCGLAAAPASAAMSDDEAHELASRSGCLSCHAITTKVVGPAYADVAARYAGDKDAVATLSQKIRTGGKGNWGRIPMPAHQDMTQDETRGLAEWVLRQKR